MTKKKFSKEAVRKELADFRKKVQEWTELNTERLDMMFEKAYSKEDANDYTREEKIRGMIMKNLYVINDNLGLDT